MYLIYYILDGAMVPVTTVSTVRLTTEWINENNKYYNGGLKYMKIGYIWR